MNRLFIFICFWMVSLCTFAQTEIKSYVSTSQTGGQFEIIQSPIARKFTFKLDKYGGYVWQLVLADDNSFTWQPVAILNMYQKYPDNDKNKDITYQIFMSGASVQDCILLNIKTGDTWQLKYSEQYQEYHFDIMK